MNNNIKRMACMAAATLMFVSMFGCTVKKSESGETTQAANPDGGVINYSELSTQNGTAVYTYKYTDKSGKEVVEKEVIDVEEMDSIEYMPQRDVKSKDFASGIAQKGYQMSDEQAKAVSSKPENYKEFMFTEYVENKSGKVMAYKAVQVENNGANNIWIKTNLDAEYTIAPGTGAYISVYGIADMTKYNDETLAAAFKEVDVDLVYTLVDSARDDIDWEKAEIKTMDIH